MVSAFDHYRRPLFWLIVCAIAAVAAYCTLREITFVPGVSFRGHLQVYALLFVLWIIAITVFWFIVRVARFLVHRSRADM